MHPATHQAFLDEMEKISVSKEWIREHARNGSAQRFSKKLQGREGKNPFGNKRPYPKEPSSERVNEIFEKRRSKSQGIVQGTLSTQKEHSRFLKAKEINSVPKPNGKFPTGKALAGAAAAGALGYGAYRLIKHLKKDKEKTAIDPMAMAGMVAGGKIMATNALNRFGHHLPPLRRLAQEVAGVGARTAMQGKPLLSAPLRHAMAVGIDPKLTSLYETAHQAAGAAKGMGGLKQLSQHLSAAKQIPELAHAAEFAQGIPLESKGLRKVVDYGFTPVSQVGRDIKGLAGRAASGVGSALKKANPMKLLKKTQVPA